MGVNFAPIADEPLPGLSGKLDRNDVSEFSKQVLHAIFVHVLSCQELQQPLKWQLYLMSLGTGGKPDT